MAKQEYVNQTRAYQILQSKGLNVPQPIKYFDSWIISEYIHGVNNNTALSDIHKSVIYLHKLHKINYRKLNLKGHYFGDILTNRLREELDFLSRGIALFPELKNMQKDFESILQIALDHIEVDEPVLGHGDFQPKNIIFQNSNLYPVDWMDFGLVLPWYELGNLLLLQKISTVQYAVNLYLQLGFKIWNPSKEKIIKAALSIAGIIRTGSYFRYIADTQSLPLEILDNIKLNMDYMKGILNYGYL